MCTTVTDGRCPTRYYLCQHVSSANNRHTNNLSYKITCSTILIFDSVSMHTVSNWNPSSSRLCLLFWLVTLHTSMFVAFILHISIFRRTTNQTSYFDVVKSVYYSLINREIIRLTRSVTNKITCNPVLVVTALQTGQGHDDFVDYHSLHHLLACILTSLLMLAFLGTVPVSATSNYYV